MSEQKFFVNHEAGTVVLNSVRLVTGEQSLLHVEEVPSEYLCAMTEFKDFSASYRKAVYGMYMRFFEACELEYRGCEDKSSYLQEATRLIYEQSDMPSEFYPKLNLLVEHVVNYLSDIMEIYHNNGSYIEIDLYEGAVDSGNKEKLFDREELNLTQFQWVREYVAQLPAGQAGRNSFSILKGSVADNMNNFLEVVNLAESMNNDEYHIEGGYDALGAIEPVTTDEVLGMVKEQVAENDKIFKISMELTR